MSQEGASYRDEAGLREKHTYWVAQQVRSKGCIRAWIGPLGLEKQQTPETYSVRAIGRIGDGARNKRNKSRVQKDTLSSFGDPAHSRGQEATESVEAQVPRFRV